MSEAIPEYSKIAMMEVLQAMLKKNYKAMENELLKSELLERLMVTLDMCSTSKIPSLSRTSASTLSLLVSKVKENNPGSDVYIPPPNVFAGSVEKQANFETFHAISDKEEDNKWRERLKREKESVRDGVVKERKEKKLREDMEREAERKRKEAEELRRREIEEKLKQEKKKKKREEKFKRSLSYVSSNIFGLIRFSLYCFFLNYLMT